MGKAYALWATCMPFFIMLRSPTGKRKTTCLVTVATRRKEIRIAYASRWLPAIYFSHANGSDLPPTDLIAVPEGRYIHRNSAVRSAPTVYLLLLGHLPAVADV